MIAVVIDAPGQAPTRDEQLDLPDRSLSVLALEDHLAVVVAHNDTDHAHWHLVVCKVHPDAGKAASLGPFRPATVEGRRAVET